MLQNAYFLAKIGADTAENEQHSAEILPTDALWRLRRASAGPEGHGHRGQHELGELREAQRRAAGGQDRLRPGDEEPGLCFF